MPEQDRSEDGFDWGSQKGPKSMGVNDYSILNLINENAAKC